MISRLTQGIKARVDYGLGVFSLLAISRNQSVRSIRHGLRGNRREHDISRAGCIDLRLFRPIWNTSASCSDDQPRVHQDPGNPDFPHIATGDLVEFCVRDDKYDLGIVTREFSKESNGFLNNQIVVVAIDGHIKLVSETNIFFRIPGWIHKKSSPPRVVRPRYFLSDSTQMPAHSEKYMKENGVDPAGLKRMDEFVYATRSLIKGINNINNELLGIYHRIGNDGDERYIAIEEIASLLFRDKHNTDDLRDEEIYAAYRIVMENDKFFLAPSITHELRDRRIVARRSLNEVKYIESLESLLIPEVSMNLFMHGKHVPHSRDVAKVSDSRDLTRNIVQFRDFTAECSSYYARGMADFIMSYSSVLELMRTRNNMEKWLTNRKKHNCIPTSDFVQHLAILLTRIMVMSKESRGYYVKKIDHLLLSHIREVLGAAENNRRLSGSSVWGEIRSLLIESNSLDIWGELSFLLNPQLGDLRFLAPSTAGLSCYLIRNQIDYMSNIVLGVKTSEDKKLLTNGKQGGCADDILDAIKIIDEGCDLPIQISECAASTPEFWISKARDCASRIEEVSNDWLRCNSKEVLENYYKKYLYPDIVNEHSLGVVPARYLVYDTDPNQHTRRDLTHLNSYAIDSSDSFEIDDSISLEELPNGDSWLHVHVADPTSFIKPNPTLLSILADRFSSIYLGSKSHLLFNNNLSQHVDLRSSNRAMTFSAKIGPDGSIMEQSVSVSTLGNTKVMTYKLAAFLMSDKYEEALASAKKESDAVSSSTKATPSHQAAVNNRCLNLHNMLQTSSDLRKIMQIVVKHRDWRIERGFYPFGSYSSASFVSRGKPSSASTPKAGRADIRLMSFSGPESDLRISSQYMIEECMLIANRVASNYCWTNSIPSLYRGLIDHRSGNTNGKIPPEHKARPSPTKDPSTPTSSEQQSEGKRTSTSDSTLLSGHCIATFPIPHPLIGVPGILSPDHKSGDSCIGYVKATSPLRRFTDLIIHFNIRAHILNLPYPFPEQNIRNNLAHIRKREKQIKKLSVKEDLYWNYMWLVAREIKNHKYVKSNKRLLSLFSSGAVAFKQFDSGIIYANIHPPEDQYMLSALGPILLPASGRSCVYRVILGYTLKYSYPKRSEVITMRSSVVGFPKLYAYIRLTGKQFQSLDLHPGKEVKAAISCIIPSIQLAIFEPLQ